MDPRRTSRGRARAAVATAAAILLPLSLGVAPVQASPDDIVFGETIVTPVGDLITSAAIGQFGGGKAPDVLVKIDNTRGTRMFVGDGEGGYDEVAGPQVPVDARLTSADLNGDGLDDMIGRSGHRGVLFVRLAEGKLAFADETTVDVRQPQTPWIADLDGDGDVDVLVGSPRNRHQHEPEGHVHVLENDGTGVLTHVFTLDRGTRWVRTGDMDDDGVVDMLLWAWHDDHLVIVRGLGDLTYGDEYEPDSSRDTLMMSSADLDGDGVADLTAAGSHDRVTVRLGLGDGTFGQSKSYFIASSCRNLLLVDDLDLDGALDILTDCAFGYCALPGRGDGSFDNEIAFGGRPREGAVLRDVDRDGRMDVIAFSSSGFAGGIYTTLNLS